MRAKAIFNWSSGKDSALALYKIFLENKYEITHLLTSINNEYQRVSMHGVPLSLLEKQSESIGIPLLTMGLPKEPSMEEYQEIITKTMNEVKSEGVTHSIFGDIFLEDLRKYREEQLKTINIEAVFPLWKKNTSDLIFEFLDLGFKTIVTCVNEAYLDKSFVGRIIDRDFIKDLPKNVDPCGENGEFHTFTFEGPIFKKPIQFEIGETIKKTYPSPNKQNIEEYIFWVCDLHI